MPNKVFPILFFSLLWHIAQAQQSFQDPHTLKWGWFDARQGVFIPAVYDDIKPAPFGFFLARKDGLLGMLNAEGKVTVPFEYLSIDPFGACFGKPSGQLLVTKPGTLPGRVGLIGHYGKEYFPVESDRIWSYANYYFIRRQAADTILSVYNTWGSLVNQLPGDSLVMTSSRRPQIKGPGGRTRNPTVWRGVLYIPESEHTIWTDGYHSIYQQPSGMMQLIDSVGRVIFSGSLIQPETHNQFIVAKVGADSLGVMDVTGKVIVPLIWKQIERLNYAFLVTGFDGKSGLYESPGGAVILPARYRIYRLPPVHSGTPDWPHPDWRYLMVEDETTGAKGLYHAYGYRFTDIAWQDIAYEAEHPALIATAMPLPGQLRGQRQMIGSKGPVLLEASDAVTLTTDQFRFFIQPGGKGPVYFYDQHEDDSLSIKYDRIQRFDNQYIAAYQARQLTLFQPNGVRMYANPDKNEIARTPELKDWVLYSRLGNMRHKLVAAVDLDKRRVKLINEKGATWTILRKTGQVLASTPVQPPMYTGKVYEMYDLAKIAGYPGGEGELHQFLKDNLQYPEAARQHQVSGVVAVSFIVETDGNITSVEIKKGLGYGCDEEALRLLSIMPRWNTAEANGHPVRLRYMLPVRFRW